MENFIECLKFIKSKLLFIAIFTFIFFFFSILYTLSLTPQYHTSIVITENSKDQAINTKSVVSLALGQSNSGALNFYHHLQEVMFSMQVTEALNKDNQLLKKTHKAYKANDGETFLPIWNLDTRLKALKFKFLGIDYSPIPNNYLLNNYFRSLIQLKYDEAADAIYLESYSDNPSESSKLIMSLLVESDNFYKIIEKDSIEQRINYLSNEISATLSISQKEALSSILEAELLKKTLINTDSFFKIKIIRGLESSEYPVTPNVLFTISIITLFGLFIILSVYTFVFLRSRIFVNKDN